MRAGIYLLAAAASLAAGMVAVGVVAEVALESSLAETYNVDADWHTGQRAVLGADLAATAVLAVLTLVVVFAARRVTADRGRVLAGILALALVLACALPSVGWFWLVAQDGLPSDKEFIQDAYGRWYFPVVGAFGAAYALAAAGAALLFLLPGRPAVADDSAFRPASQTAAWPVSQTTGLPTAASPTTAWPASQTTASPTTAWPASPTTASPTTAWPASPTGDGSWPAWGDGSNSPTWGDGGGGGQDSVGGGDWPAEGKRLP